MRVQWKQGGVVMLVSAGLIACGSDDDNGQRTTDAGQVAGNPSTGGAPDPVREPPTGGSGGTAGTAGASAAGGDSGTGAGAAPSTGSGPAAGLGGGIAGTGGTSGRDGTGGTADAGGADGTAGSAGTAGTGGGSSGAAGRGGTAGAGGTSGSGGAAGAGGTSGSGGTAGASGTSGSGGTAGAGGTSGSGGVAGAGGTGGTAGTGGTGGDPDPGGDCETNHPGWTLVWADEFDYDGLPDPSRWGYEVGGHGWGNGEAQYYTDGRMENAVVDQATGLLTITARRESWEGNQYTSAKLNSGLGTNNPGSWVGALIEIRARLPAGRGTWPAFWMMPDDCAEGWPNCGEIDIMEHVGYDEGRIHGTIHTDAFNHMEGTQIGDSVVVPDATSAFHVYALEWDADRLQWSVDGSVYHTIDRQPGWGFAEWPFNDKPFHIKINIAIGGSWGGAQGIDDTIFPVDMDLDYVCVYQSAA